MNEEQLEAGQKYGESIRMLGIILLMKHKGSVDDVYKHIEEKLGLRCDGEGWEDLTDPNRPNL